MLNSREHRTRWRIPSHRGEWLVVGALAAIWSLVVAWLAVTEHLAFNTGYDLATFAQVVWATAKGRPFYTSLTAGTANFLGLHFSPLLAVLAPFYGIWPDARLLLIAQAVVLAIGAIPLFVVARTRLGCRLALLVVAVYFLYPPLHYVGLFEFHAIAFSVPPLWVKAPVPLLPISTLRAERLPSLRS